MSYDKRVYRDLPVRPEAAYQFEQTPFQNLLDGPVMRSFGEFPGGRADTAITSPSLYPNSSASQKLGSVGAWGEFSQGPSLGAFGQKMDGKLASAPASLQSEPFFGNLSARPRPRIL